MSENFNENEYTQNYEKGQGILDYIIQNPDKLQNNIDELVSYLKEVQNLNKKNYESHISFTKKFDELKNSYEEIETKFLKMCESIDEISSSMQAGDYNTNKCLCAQKYSAFWSKLDDASKDFLITANYLCKRCEGEQFDFSPVIVEMSRVYENELLKKIFGDFIKQKANSTLVLQSEGNRDILHKVISDVKKGFPMFISLTQMVNELKHIQGHTEHSYGRALMDELQVDWNTNKLADNAFFNRGNYYAKNYRNRAAHPGSKLSKIDADNCDNMSQNLLDHFIGSMK